ncbi:MAG: efflux RND transporter periplasmic adaptor subunit [Planctomycetota bacterium]
MFAVTLCFAAACGGGTGAAPQSESSPVQEGPAIVRLTAASAARHGIADEAAALHVLRRHLVAPARVAFDADRTAHVGCALRGRVASVNGSLGAAVAAGDPLFSVDSPELGEAQLELLQRSAALEAAAPKVAFAEQSYLAAKAVFDESQGIAEAEVLRREAEFKAAAAAVRQAEVAVAAARDRLQLLGMQLDEVEAMLRSGAVSPRLVVRAPFAGTIVARDVTLGELVAPDRAMLMTIADTSVLWVLAAVPESRLGDAVAGADAQVLFDASPLPVAGTVELVPPTVDATTRCAEVRIVVETPPAQLRAGMFVSARIAVPLSEADRGGVLAVPEQAVQSVDGHAVVFVPVAGEAHAWRMRQIEVGRAVEGYVPVRAGLRAGERVVTTGSFVLEAQATMGGAGDEEGN